MDGGAQILTNTVTRVNDFWAVMILEVISAVQMICLTGEFLMTAGIVEDTLGPLNNLHLIRGQILQPMNLATILGLLTVIGDPVEFLLKIHIKKRR